LNRCAKLQNGATEATQLEYLLLHVQAGEVDEVAPMLLACAENNHPEAPLILETLSRAYLTHLRYGPALDCLGRWMKAQPEAALPLTLRGAILEQLNNPEGAKEDYLLALKLDPELVHIRLRVAALLLAESNPPEALPHLERLMKDHPDRPDVMARMGQYRFLQGKWDQARPLLEAAVKKLPNDPDLLITLAKLDMDASPPRAEQAEQRLRHVLKADPTDLEAQYQLIGCLQAQNRKDEAAALADQYGKDKAQRKRVDQVLKDEVRHSGSNNAQALCEAGAFLLRSGQDKQGAYWLVQALERDRTYKPAHKALAEYYERKGDPEQARAHRQAADK
jgi:tetratricopeptide (TPR) repeat protein